MPHHGDVALVEAVRALLVLATQPEQLAGHRVCAGQAVVSPVGGGGRRRRAARHRRPARALLDICEQSIAGKHEGHEWKQSHGAVHATRV